MHVRGKDFEYTAVFPDGKKEILLSVPQYDFNWQSAYRLKTPKRLPAGTRIECTAHYDNSKGNPANPAGAPALVVQARVNGRTQLLAYNTFANSSPILINSYTVTAEIPRKTVAHNTNSVKPKPAVCLSIRFS